MLPRTFRVDDRQVVEGYASGQKRLVSQHRPRNSLKAPTDFKLDFDWVREAMADTWLTFILQCQM